jgi:hypothetical protein
MGPHSRQNDSNPAGSTSPRASLMLKLTVEIKFDQDVSAGKLGAASAKIF